MQTRRTEVTATANQKGIKVIDRTPIHRRGDDMLLDAIAAAKLSMLEGQFDRKEPILDGIPPNSKARPGRFIADAERELADTLRWLDALIATLPDDDAAN
jgi:hypothetical protein